MAFNNQCSSSSAFLLQSNESLMLSDPADHIKVGSFYEIDHTKLPPKCPHQLNSIRIVMVNEKTRMRVSLRLPSVFSLRAYFNEINYSKQDIKKVPALDEKCIMGSEVAAEVLYRRIPPHEITEKRHIWRFWAVPSITAQKLISNNNYYYCCRAPSRNVGTVNVVSTKKGSLLSQIKDTGMVKWGQRRRIRYLARHMDHEDDDDDDDDDDNNNELMLSCNVIPGKEDEEEEEEEEGSEKDEDGGGGGGDDDDVKKGKGKSGKNLKRKQRGFSTIETTAEKKKDKEMVQRPKSENNNQIVVYKHNKKQKVFKNSIDRWSSERYHMAEVNMLKIMKEQNAVFGKPMLRPELRTQARKLIGDTGLLDHLLKHMAGKVAPGGEERFRRRHNAEGAMEYWLEKADLVDIRREAGVQDPYWTPPPGWNPGDNPTQDPICANQIKDLKQEIAKLKRDMEELLSKKQEEQLAIASTPISPVTGHILEHDHLIIPLKEMYIDLMNKKAEIEEQLLEISQSLCGMEEGMGKLKTTMEETNKTETSKRRALMELPESVISVKQKKEVKGSKSAAPAGTKSPATSEGKAAKIERLKSGFRICKPQGTFLWPNKGTSSPQVMVQFEDLFSVPTPPSVSSTSATQTNLLSNLPYTTPATSPPKKPLAEKRSVTTINALSSSALTTPTLDQNSSITTISTTSSTITKTCLINLNEPPGNQNDNGLLCGGSQSQSQAQASSYPVTYQRRNHHPSVTNTAMPSLGAAKKERNQWEGNNNDQGKELIRCCSASSTTSPCLSAGAGTWLALATSKQATSATKSKGA